MFMSDESGELRSVTVHTAVSEVASVPLPTDYGEFLLRAFARDDRPEVIVALIMGDLGDGRSVLTRIHSECLTGDALASRRCDCGSQLQSSMRTVASEGRGLVLYVVGHEGRGTGLVAKLKAYAVQDLGLDTVDANVALGLSVDSRDYRGTAAVLQALGVTSVRLLTNNPAKGADLCECGIEVEERVPAHVAPHVRNAPYLAAKHNRLGHAPPKAALFDEHVDEIGGTTELLGEARPHADRPYVVLKYAQTLDGRIATRSGDSHWISSERERRLAHAMRAASDAVLVGIGTVVADDPLLTVRLVPGNSPMRVVLDSRFRIPLEAQVLNDHAATTVVTTEAASTAKRETLLGRGVSICTVKASPTGVDLADALRALLELGVSTLVVEGGSRVITSFLEAGLADRAVIAIAPIFIGRGREAVGDLGVGVVADALQLERVKTARVGRDFLVVGDVDGQRSRERARAVAMATRDGGERA
jgi:GTP cyclohydrolase II